ncbi:MAG: cob(I)yrinic acid a,c-diamide adenosyltransferase [Planctomycetia bacterium]|nr:cob(I)yrinic acid a,c-diamide adenosyltransferase [Planctomycetia bacterium]
MALDKRRRIYTRRGDLGETSLCFGPRVGKDQIRIIICGQLDELNSFLGLIRTEKLAPGIEPILVQIQKKIFQLSSEITTYSPAKHEIPVVGPNDIQELEQWIDAWEPTLPPLTNFILPGGCRSAALFHVARSVCRRAERHVVLLIRKDPSVSRFSIGWLNRLSDLLFIFARAENLANHFQEENV